MSNAVRVEVVFCPGEEGAQFLRAGSASDEISSEVSVNVVYTTEAGTRSALELAGKLAHDLRVKVRLIFVHAVHHALPLTEPAISLPFLRDKLTKLASLFPGDAAVHIYLCRDALRTLEMILPRSSPVVLGGKRRRWTTRAQRLNDRLEELGHQVIFAESR